MSLERLVKEARERMGETAEIRLQQSRKRSEDFNRKFDSELKSQDLTKDLLNKVIDL